MIVLATAVLFLLLGYTLVWRLFDDDWGRLERACFASVAGGALWIASSWALLLTHTFTRTALAIRLLLVLAAIAVLGRDRLRATARSVTQLNIESFLGKVIVIAFLPVVAWIFFILWRGALIPPLSHDALSYHLPKAVLMVRNAGYDHLHYLHPLIRVLPINYELFLAEEIAWSGTDKYTEWPSLLFYLLLVLGAGALAERWWRGESAGPAVVMIATAAVPVALLHSGAQKNDLLTSAFLVAAIVAAGRWFAENDFRSLVVSIAAFAIAIGTKPQAGVLALCLVPLIVWRLMRRPKLLGAVVVVSVVAFLTLGGAVYVGNVIHEGSLLDARASDGEQTIDIVPYGAWRTLWQGPYVLLAAPFSTSRWFLKVPWESDPWFWRRYEMYFSHLGVIFSLCAVAAPFVVAASLRRLKSDIAARERVAMTGAVLVTVAVMLPVHFRPHGMYAISLPRYVLFAVPIVFAWTLVPLLRKLEGRSWIAAAAALAVAALWFSAQAIEYGARDIFVPPSYLRYALEHRGTRVVAFDPNRAASLADRAAGPAERIAIDGGFGSWIHPAFGADLKRPVTLLLVGRERPQIPDDVRWVAIDRAYSAVWGHPSFNDLSRARRYLARGQPSAGDLRLFEHLRADPRWELVVYNPGSVQALFRRVR